MNDWAPLIYAICVAKSKFHQSKNPSKKFLPNYPSKSTSEQIFMRIKIPLIINFLQKLKFRQHQVRENEKFTIEIGCHKIPCN